MHGKPRGREAESQVNCIYPSLSEPAILHGLGHHISETGSISICRNKLKVCSDVCFYAFAILRSFVYSLSHEDWHKKGRTPQD
jgi:hypothetical protein